MANVDEESSFNVHDSGPDTRLFQTSQSKRLQELLLGCAAFFDETVLDENLQNSTWVHRVCTIFHDYPFALSISDTSKVGMPFVYVNKAFCTLTGFAEANLLGANMSILNGPNTELSQLSVMQSSARSTSTVKFSITFQSKQKKDLFDLVAQQAIGNYCIATHYVRSRNAPLQSLNVS